MQFVCSALRMITQFHNHSSFSASFSRSPSFHLELLTPPFFSVSPPPSLFSPVLCFCFLITLLFLPVLLLPPFLNIFIYVVQLL